MKLNKMSTKQKLKKNILMKNWHEIKEEECRRVTMSANEGRQTSEDLPKMQINLMQVSFYKKFPHHNV